MAKYSCLHYAYAHIVLLQERVRALEAHADALSRSSQQATAQWQEAAGALDAARAELRVQGQQLAAYRDQAEKRSNEVRWAGSRGGWVGGWGRGDAPVADLASSGGGTPGLAWPGEGGWVVVVAGTSPAAGARARGMWGAYPRADCCKRKRRGPCLACTSHAAPLGRCSSEGSQPLFQVMHSHAPLPPLNPTNLSMLPHPTTTLGRLPPPPHTHTHPTPPHPAPAGSSTPCSRRGRRCGWARTRRSRP